MISPRRDRLHRCHSVYVLFCVGLGLCLGITVAQPLRLTFSPSFPQGVASGDVDATSVVLWARAINAGPLKFSYSTQSNLVAAIELSVSNRVDSAQPVKVAISGLLPETSYYYRVTDSSGEFMDGRFRTSATPGTFRGLRFGVSGDWQGQLAPFVSIADAPDRELHFFVALGDTMYADVFSPVMPDRFARTLPEFRVKHAEILTEKLGLNTMASLRASTAFYATVDDHEWTNGLAGGEAVNPSVYPNEPLEAKTVNQTGFFKEGMQAFLEYQPISEAVYSDAVDPNSFGRHKLYRARRFGSDAALLLLDTRSFRDAEISSPGNPLSSTLASRFESISLEVDPDTGAALPHRTLLGPTQFAALTNDLVRAEADGVIWKFVIIPEPVQNLGFAGAEDRYEGYAAERRDLLKMIHDIPIQNVVFITADLHGTLVNNLTYRLVPGGTNIDSGAFEVITGAVAHDKTFGPTAFDYAAGVKISAAVSLLDLLLKFIQVASRADFDALPLPERDRLFESVINTLLNVAGLDPLGFNGSVINAQWEVGGPVAAHSYGWTEFELDRNTHELVVTTRGIPAYTTAEISPAIVTQIPKVLSQFRVFPQNVTPPLRANIRNEADGIVISWRGSAVLECSASLETNDSWVGSPESVKIEGADQVVRTKATELQRFFRLRPLSPQKGAGSAD